jgi:hypothetical protein
MSVVMRRWDWTVRGPLALVRNDSWTGTVRPVWEPPVMTRLNRSTGGAWSPWVRTSKGSRPRVCA